MLLKYFSIPLMDDSEQGGAATAATTVDTTAQTGVNNTGAADQAPDGSQPNAAWAEMRRKAKLADDYEKKVKDYESKFDKIGKKALPEGYKSVDEYLEYLDTLEDTSFVPESTEQPPVMPVIDENKIIDAIYKKVEELPLLKQVKKEHQDRFLVNSFTEVQKVFSDIKKPEDIPVGVWDAWDEGKSNRTLVSHLKEYRYDQDIEAARKTGANQGKAAAMSTAHTAQVNSANAALEYDNVIVPEKAKKDFENMGIKDPLKQKMYYKKYHRPE